MTSDVNAWTIQRTLNPMTLEDTRQHLRGRVYRVFDEMFEEATGKRPRRNQGVWDALERWKTTGGTVNGIARGAAASCLSRKAAEERPAGTLTD